MSTIAFVCSAEMKGRIIAGVRQIVFNHYFSSVHPNTRAKYENEGKAVYSERLNHLMDSELFTVEETDEGVAISFDTTEEAGFAITHNVYKTSMGYSDNGLTYIEPVIDEIVKAFPSVCFTAKIEAWDKWMDELMAYSYDGHSLTKEELEDEDEEFDEDEDEDEE